MIRTCPTILENFTWKDISLCFDKYEVIYRFLSVNMNWSRKQPLEDRVDLKKVTEQIIGNNTDIYYNA